MKTVEANNIEELQSINHIIHDLWFNINDTFYDEESHIFCLNLEEMANKQFLTICKIFHRGKSQTQNVKWSLVFKNVLRVVIIDHEMVEFYDINELVYDSTTNTIKISTGIPILINIEVKSLEVSLKQI